MRPRFQRFLLLFLLLALPVQALASAAMLGRALAQHAPAPHHAMAAAEPPEDAAMATCHAPEAAPVSSSQHDCQHCTACYLASSVLIPAVMPFLETTPAAAVRPDTDSRFAGHIPEGPERPPRTPLA